MTAERDPYDVLGIAPSAPAEDVAAAYRAQARRHHPDVSRAPDAEEHMAAINAAWALLRDPAGRAVWDRAHGITPQVARRQPAQGATRDAAAADSTRPHPASGPTRPAWAGATAAGRPTQSEWRRGPHGEGAAGPPPGGARGSVLSFGRHIGWSLGEIARVDPGYLVWLHGRREGAPYREEIDRLLSPTRADTERTEPATRRRRLFR